MKFLHELVTEKAFLIISGFYGKSIVPQIYDKPQLNSIYVFCNDVLAYEELCKAGPKVKGVYNYINYICEDLKLDCERHLRRSIPMSFDGIDESFIYSQLLKKIFLDIEDDDDKDLKGLFKFCRAQAKIMKSEAAIYEKVLSKYSETVNDMWSAINKMEKEYRQRTPIYWYTYQSFLYSMLNQAFRELEVDTLYAMCHFIRHLHNRIVQLGQQQQQNSGKFKVYRGQELALGDFDKMQKTVGAFMCFNCFLSTSLDLEVSMSFISGAVHPGNVRILFEMTIDPKLWSLTPFAYIAGESAFPKENEILFSTHTVFCINKIQEISVKEIRLWQVELTLGYDDNPRVNELFERVSTELASRGGEKGWSQLGYMLIKLEELPKAEELYQLLLKKDSDDSVKAYYNFKLGDVYHAMKYYEKAIGSYQRACDIYKRIYSSNDIKVVQCYNNMGAVYRSMGELNNDKDNYNKAIDYYEKTRDILEKVTPMNSEDLAACYSNMGIVYVNQKKYAEADHVYKKALDIRERTSTANDAGLAALYASVGVYYDKRGMYSEAIDKLKKAIELEKKILHPNHPEFGTLYNNLGVTYYNNKQYAEAFDNFEKALQIKKKAWPAGDRSIIITEKWIADTRKKMSE